jgi:hypothetical protein
LEGTHFIAYNEFDLAPADQRYRRYNAPSRLRLWVDVRRSLKCSPGGHADTESRGFGAAERLFYSQVIDVNYMTDA